MKFFFKQPRKSTIINVFLFVLFAVVVLGSVFFAGTAMGQSAFTTPTPDFQGLSQMPSEKQTVLARSLYPTVLPNALAPKVSGPNAIPTLVPHEFLSDFPHRAAGAGMIVVNVPAPLPATAYGVSNAWFAATGTEKISVYAGGEWNALHTDRSQGFILVIYKKPDDNTSRPAVMVESPAQTGALQIMDATGMKLTLQSEKGVTYFLDVNAGQFVSK